MRNTYIKTNRSTDAIFVCIIFRLPTLQRVLWRLAYVRGCSQTPFFYWRSRSIYSATSPSSTIDMLSVDARTFFLASPLKQTVDVTILDGFNCSMQCLVLNLKYVSEKGLYRFYMTAWRLFSFVKSYTILFSFNPVLTYIQCIQQLCHQNSLIKFIRCFVNVFTSRSYAERS